MNLNENDLYIIGFIISFIITIGITIKCLNSKANIFENFSSKKHNKNIETLESLEDKYQIKKNKKLIIQHINLFNKKVSLVLLEKFISTNNKDEHLFFMLFLKNYDNNLNYFKNYIENY